MRGGQDLSGHLAGHLSEPQFLHLLNRDDGHDSDLERHVEDRTRSPASNRSQVIAYHVITSFARSFLQETLSEPLKGPGKKLKPRGGKRLI